MAIGNLMKVESIAFDQHRAIIGVENQFSVFLRVTVLHRFDYTIEVFVKNNRT